MTTTKQCGHPLHNADTCKTVLLNYTNLTNNNTHTGLQQISRNSQYCTMLKRKAVLEVQTTTIGNPTFQCLWATLRNDSCDYCILHVDSAKFCVHAKFFTSVHIYHGTKVTLSTLSWCHGNLSIPGYEHDLLVHVTQHCPISNCPVHFKN